LTRRLLHFHLLLGITLQRPGRVSLGTQSLNRCCDCCLIRRKRLPDGGVIVDVLRHHVQHLRKICQRDKCRIEPLFLRCIGKLRAAKPGVLLQPVIRVQNFLGVGRSGCNLRQQGIRVKCDRSQQLIQLLRRGDRRLGRQQGSKILGNYQGDQQNNRRKTSLSHGVRNLLDRFPTIVRVKACDSLG
jgi:hypothetical protein